MALYFFMVYPNICCSQYFLRAGPRVSDVFPVFFVSDGSCAAFS